jgi:Ca-activated chloride channel homolog
MNIKVQNKINKSIPITFNIRLLALTLAALVTSACNQSNIKTQQENPKQAEVIAHDQYEKTNVKHVLPVEQVAELVMSPTIKGSSLSRRSLIIPRHLSSESFLIPAFIDSDLDIIQTDINNENYLTSLQNPVKQVNIDPVSTFSIDVDTGSYSNSRRLLNRGQLPPSDAVREEAFINYFNYNYRGPTETTSPFNVHTEIGNAPWNKQRQLLKIGIKGFEIEKTDLKAANLVFLLDVSGSMSAPDKLPLLKTSLTMLTKQLDENDSVAIVVYAGAAGVVLPATAGNERLAITTALNQLEAGGSTNGAQGIELAYQIAQKNFKEEGVNRVILATDGDFNVGIHSIDKLKALIAKKRETGIALTTLGFGQGNYNDGLMEQLANVGNGQHAYIDNLNEARKVLVDELSSTLQIIAKDVKIQVEFNPQHVAEYRLIGYQNRLLANEDFNNDQVDAAELGAGHTVTALYEITLVGSESKQIDELRYQDKKSSQSDKINSNISELAFVKIRYKQPNSDDSQLLSQAVIMPMDHAQTSDDFKFASAVAGFAQLLKGAKYTGQWQYEDCANLAQQNKGDDLFGYRAEFIQLVRTASALQ